MPGSGQGPDGPMQHVVMPSFQGPSHVKAHNVTSVAWPTRSMEKQGHMRPSTQGHLQANPILARSAQQTLEQQGLSNESSRLLVAESFLRHNVGQATFGQHGYEQMTMSQPMVSMAQRASAGMGFSHRQPAVAAPCGHVALPSTAISEGSAVAGVASRVDSLGKTEPQMSRSPDAGVSGNSFTDPKSDTFAVEDELSLSTTLFNMSLEHDFGADFPGRAEDSRPGAEGIDGGMPPTVSVQSRGVISDARGFAASAAHGGTGGGVGSGGPEPDNVGLNALGTASLPMEPRQLRVEEPYRYPRLDLTASVNDLLFSPAELQMGISLVRNTTTHYSPTIFATLLL